MSALTMHVLPLGENSDLTTFEKTITETACSHYTFCQFKFNIGEAATIKIKIYYPLGWLVALSIGIVIRLIAPHSLKWSLSSYVDAL